MTTASSLASLCDQLIPIPAYAGISSDLAKIAKTLRSLEKKITTLERQKALKNSPNAGMVAALRLSLYHHHSYASPLGVATRKALGMAPGSFLTSAEIAEMHVELEKLRWPDEKGGCRVKNE